jgi:hypothetical protein
MAIAGWRSRCHDYPVNLMLACQSARGQKGVCRLSRSGAAIVLLHPMLQACCSMGCGGRLTVLHKTVAEPH